MLAVPVVIAAVSLFVGVRWVSPRTPAGITLTGRARRFQDHIRTTAAGQDQREEETSTFSRHLPYAIVLGCSDHWARAFADLDRAALGAGVRFVGDSYSATYLSSSMDDFSSSTGGSFSSTSSGGGWGGGSGGW